MSYSLLLLALSASAVMGLLSALLLVALYLVYKRRAEQPLMFRGPYMVIAGTLSGYVCSCIIFLYLLTLLDPTLGISSLDFCGPIQWAAWLGMVVFMCSYLFRALRLVHIFAMLFQPTPLKMSKPHKWRRYVLTERTLLLGLLCAVIFFAAIKVLVDEIVDNGNDAGWVRTSYGCSASSAMAWLVLYSLEFLVLLGLLWRLRWIRSEYGIAGELTGVGR